MNNLPVIFFCQAAHVEVASRSMGRDVKGLEVGLG